MNNLYKGLHEEVLSSVDSKYLLTIDESIFVKNNVLMNETCENRELINEGFLKNLTKDVAEFIIGGLSELSGLPADTLVNTVAAIDAADSVVSAIDQMTSGNPMIEEIKQLVSNIDISKGPDVIYTSVLALIKKFANVGGTKILETLKKPIDKILNSLSRLLGKVVNVIVPYDPGFSGKFAEIGSRIIKSVAEGSVFDLAKSGYGMLPEDVRKGLQNPEQAANKIIGMTAEARQALIEIQDQINQKSLGKSIKNFAGDVLFAPVTLGGSLIAGPVVRKIANSAQNYVIDNAIKYINSPTFKDDILNTMLTAKSLLTFFFALNAALQIISREEYKQPTLVPGLDIDLAQPELTVDASKPYDYPPSGSSLEDFQVDMIAEWTKRYKSIL